MKALKRAIGLFAATTPLWCVTSCSDDSNGTPPPPPTSFTLTVTKDGQGWVQSVPVGIDCAGDCTTQAAAFDAGTTVTLSARAACGHRFAGWSGDCAGTADATVTLDAHRACTATFEVSSDTAGTLEAGSLTVELQADATYGMVMGSIKHQGADTVEWTGAGGPLWRLELWASDRQARSEHLGPDDAESFACWVGAEADPTALSLVWSGLTASTGDRFDLTVTARARPADDQVGFAAEVAHDATGPARVGVGRLDLPLLDIVDPGAEAELFVPACGGLRFRAPAESAMTIAGKPLDLRYPALQNMRFVALTDGARTATLLLGSDDPATERFALKRFVAGAREPGAVRLALGRLPAEPFMPRSFALEGEAVLAAVDCPHAQACWHGAASWYRQQLEAEAWLERGPIAELDATERATLGFAALNLIGADGSGALPDYDGYAQYLSDTTTWLGLTPESTISVWYDWHANPFDSDLPEHMPPKAGFAEAVAAARAQGFWVLPYTNTTAWATDLPSYSSLDVANRAGVLQPDGSPLLHSHRQGQYHHALDFAVPWVFEHFDGYLFQPLLNDVGLSGFYLDFFPSGIPCYAGHHGHPVGGGSSYIEGVRDYVRSIASLSEQHSGRRLVATENMGDYIADLTFGANCYRDTNFFDVSDARVGHVPLFDAVFHDRVPMLTVALTDMPGVQLYLDIKAVAELGDDTLLQLLRDDVHLRMAFAYAAGHSLVLVRRPVVDVARGVDVLRDDPHLGDLAEFYRAATQLRALPRVAPFLIEGTIAPPPIVSQVDTVDSPVVTHQVLPYEQSAVPVVFSNAFQDADGNLAVTLVNWGRDPATVHLVIDPDLYGMEHDGSQLSDTWTVTAFSPAGEQLLTSDLNQNPEWLLPTFDASFPSRQPWVLVYERQ